MKNQTHRFSVMVNCNLPDDSIVSDQLQDQEVFYEDNGFIMLPDSYTETGEATRMVINCHGACGAISAYDSMIEKTALSRYLVANGYAVMDVNGLPQQYAEENGIDIRNNIGSPIAIRSYVKAYQYCIKYFNVKPEVFVHGGSMGGISSINLVLSGLIPVIAHSALCPVVDTYHQIFLHPWSDGLPKIAIGKIYGFETDKNGEFIYDEAKVMGYNPARNKRAESYPVPVKFWHCVDDDIVSYEVTKRFVEQIQKAGGMAYLRTFPYGGHEPQLAGECVKKPVGIDVFREEKIQVSPAEEEVFIWIRNFS